MWRSEWGPLSGVPVRPLGPRASRPLSKSGRDARGPSKRMGAALAAPLRCLFWMRFWAGLRKTCRSWQRYRHVSCRAGGFPMALKIRLGRRQLLRLAGAVAVFAAGSTAWPQTYPSRPVRMIVPFAPGGSVDIIGRIVAQKLADSLGGQFYVENIPTGATNVANAMTAKSPPDGHTILFVTSSFVINPSYYRKINYDAVNEFPPIALLPFPPHLLTSNFPIPVTNVKELIALVRRNPAKYIYASAGTGQSPQL